jgi:molybdenum cofactor biosynthesis protein B
VRCAVLTVSDTRRGRDDRSGAVIEAALTRARHVVVVRAWVADEPAAIRKVVRGMLARSDLEAIVITGGTGLSPRDRTPEAVEPLVDRWIPGFGEVFRTLSLRQVGAAAWMSRASAALCRGRLVFLLPGSVPAVRLALRRLIVPELVHATRVVGRVKREER